MDPSTLQSMLETAPDAIVAVDEDGRIVFANAQAGTLFGYRRDELLGQPVEVLVPEADRAVHPTHRRRYVADPRPRPMGAGMQLTARRRDGTSFPAEISLSSITTPAGLLVSAAVRDVTDRLEAHAERERLRAEAAREQVEAQLQRSQRLESLGQLAGGVAHDFNNLLAVILNYTTFVDREVTRAAASDPDRWERVRQDVAQVRRAADRAAELTQRLLAFGRREVIQPRPLVLGHVVADLVPMLRRTLGEHVDLQVRTDPAEPAVLADPGQIEQVLVNLAVNARDAMPTGGTLSIETAPALEQDADGAVAEATAQVRLRVRDTGTGMAPEVAARAFEPFFTTKPKGEGSGLGLASVYGIISQAGGWIDLSSEPGGGTTIDAFLPVTGQTPAPVEEAAEPVASTGAESILLVEDEPALRAIVERILVDAGYAVRTAPDGAAALALLDADPSPIDLLLSDVIMPGMLGPEVAEHVLRARPGVRVLFMSGYAQPMLASKGTLDEGVALVQKPFSEAELLDRVREVLDA